MCVIVIKPAGIEMPDKELLKKCWADNPDGAGFSVTPKGSSVSNVEKGFLTFKHFNKYLNRCVQSIDDLVVMHFRWATHGYRSAGHTHPFPISRKRSELERLKYTAGTVVFHNGIIRIKNQPKTWSDTMYYVGGMLAYMDQLELSRIEKHIKGSRLCIIQDGSPILLGDGWVKENDLIFSNMVWKDSKRKVVYYSGGSSLFSEMSDAEFEEHLKTVEKFSQAGEVKRPYDTD